MHSDEQQRWQADAEESFQQARGRAFLQDAVRQLEGRPTDLLAFEDVKDRLGLLPSSDRGLREVPLDKIVGSVGRYREFNRSFLPRDKRVRGRWKRIYAEAKGMTGLPPIEVYQVGDVYFIKDGNHRVSVARQMGAKTIEAYVTGFVSPVPLSADTDMNELILRSEEARFLQRTRLRELRPEAKVEVTNAGYHEKLEEHIAVHGYFLGLEKRRDISWSEAVASWYDNVYMPMVRVIREHKTLQEFPGRTETDLYLWIIEHRHYLTQDLGQEIDLAQAAKDFAERCSPWVTWTTTRPGVLPTCTAVSDGLAARPTVGQWREERVRPRSNHQLFADILVPIDGSQGSWCALEQGLSIALHEKARLYGLYVATSEAASAQAPVLQAEFSQRCSVVGVPVKFMFEVGPAAQVISSHARFVDLTVLSEQGEHAKWRQRPLGSTFQAVTRRAPGPVLAVLDHCAPLTRCVLAYDGSPQSREALFVAAHLAANWTLPLSIVTVEESRRGTHEALDWATAYLREHGIKAEALLREGRIANAILSSALEQGADLVIMGASGYSPFAELFVRSTLDQVLRHTTCPVLICR